MVLQRLVGRENEAEEKESAIDYSAFDVHDLYQLLHNEPLNGHVSAVTQAGLDLGHIGILERALEVGGTGRRPSVDQLKECLRSAVPLRGLSLWDEHTSVGACFQGIYGKSYLSASVKLKDENFPEGELCEISLGDVIEHPERVRDLGYHPDQMRDFIAGMVLVSKGYLDRETLDRMVTEKYSGN